MLYLLDKDLEKVDRSSKYSAVLSSSVYW